MEGLASVIIIWRPTGTRSLSETAERRSRRGVAISFWLLAPWIAAGSVRDLAVGHHAGTTVTGIALTIFGRELVDVCVKFHAAPGGAPGWRNH